jgi:uncharacterized protein with PIN domain
MAGIEPVILFCDTSALIKLLISEPGSNQIQHSSTQAEAVAVFQITWAEAMVAMAREQLIQSWPL